MGGFYLDLAYAVNSCPKFYDPKFSEETLFSPSDRAKVEIHIFCLLLQSGLKNNKTTHFFPEDVILQGSRLCIEVLWSITRVGSPSAWATETKPLGPLVGTRVPGPAFPLHAVPGPQNVVHSRCITLFCRRVSGSHETWCQFGFPGVTRQARQIGFSFLWMVTWVQVSRLVHWLVGLCFHLGLFELQNVNGGFGNFSTISEQFLLAYSITKILFLCKFISRVFLGWFLS